MRREADSATDVSLLGRLRRNPADQHSWGEFVRRYGPRILAWCRHWHLQEADAEDVTQVVLTKLVQRMAAFEYDATRRFRSWLKTVTHHALHDYVEARRRPGEGSGDSQVHRLIDAVEAGDDLARCLEAEFDRELLETAILRVRRQLSDQYWETFRLTALEGLSGADVARRLGMKVATVYTTKSKVHKLLQEEVRRLEAAEEAPGELR